MKVKLFTCTEGHEGQINDRNGLPLGKKGIANGRCVVTKNHEVVHLEKITAGDAYYRPYLRFPTSRRGYGFRLRGQFLASRKN